MKKENKEMKAQLVDLQKKIEAGGSRAEITADLQEIAAEWPEVDPKFLKKFADTVRAQAKAEAKEDVEASLKPLKEKERSEKINGLLRRIMRRRRLKPILNSRMWRTRRSSKVSL